MKIRKLTIALLAALLTSGVSAQDRELITLIEATELSPANIIFPQSVNGMMTYRPCEDDCAADYERARLTGDTQFLVNGRGVRFADFQKSFALIKTNKDGYALVSVDTKTRTVVSIQIQG